MNMRSLAENSAEIPVQTGIWYFIELAVYQIPACAGISPEASPYEFVAF
jgi:hypothetical protein